MDPVSLAASILTLISATTVSVSGVIRLWKLRGSPEYLCPAINEITDFNATLELIRTTLEKDGFDQDVRKVLEDLTGRAKGQIDDFYEFLGGLLKDASSADKLSLKSRAKVSELLGTNERRIQNLRAEIASIKSSISAALNVANARSLPLLKMSIQQIAVISPTGQSTFASPADTIQQTASLLENISSTSEPGNGTSQVPLNETTAIQRTRLGELVQQQHSFQKATTTTSSTSYVMLQMKPTSRSCRPQCPCQCHIPFEGQTPRWLRGLMGAAFFSSTGLPILNHRSCNVTNCGVSPGDSGKIYFQYFLPTWLLPWGIQMTGSWKNLTGVGGTWNLKIPKVITDQDCDGDIASLVERGLAVRLLRYLSSKKIGINVLFPDGQSIFEFIILWANADMICKFLEEGIDLEFQTETNITLGQCLLKAAITYPDSLKKVWSSPVLESVMDTAKFSALHRIITGLNHGDISAQIGLDPISINAVDCFGLTPLHWAIKTRSIITIDLLLEAGANINAQCHEGRSVLHYTVTLGLFEVFHRLIAAGADVTITERYGKNALFAAAETPDVDPAIIPLLLKKGVDINSREKRFQRTCLHDACMYSSVAFCSALIENGADLNAIDADGRSPIFYAIMEDMFPNVELLIKKGAILTRLTNDGLSVLHYVAEYGGVEIMRLLQSARIKGLSMEREDIRHYWWLFHQGRRISFVGQPHSQRVELWAFRALLDSIIPGEYTPPSDDDFKIPGAFPLAKNTIQQDRLSPATESREDDESWDSERHALTDDNGSVGTSDWEEDGGSGENDQEPDVHHTARNLSKPLQDDLPLAAVPEEEEGNGNTDGSNLVADGEDPAVKQNSGNLSKPQQDQLPSATLLQEEAGNGNSRSNDAVEDGEEAEAKDTPCNLSTALTRDNLFDFDFTAFSRLTSDESIETRLAQQSTTNVHSETAVGAKLFETFWE